jgi:uncharacterized protein
MSRLGRAERLDRTGRERQDAAMPGSGGSVSRRDVLRGLGLLGGGVLLAGCGADFADARLRLATGDTEGGYFALGTALAEAWRRELSLATPPSVLSTMGSIDNLRLLLAGQADLVFCQVDVAADRVNRGVPDSPTAPRALARIYDDMVHVVTPAASPITTLARLRGARVSLGAPDSGVYFIAQRLLDAAGLAERDIQVMRLGIAESAAALAAGRLEAFFWSGALPTRGVSALAAQLPIRLLDLADVVGPMCAAYPEYAPGTVPAGSYGIPAPVTGLLVRNVLLVDAGMSDALAEALTSTMFATQEELARASSAALTIDPRAAIGTQPVLLHPGAERFYRAQGN